MSKNVRRFAAALCLSAMLATTPAIAAPSRDSGYDRDRSSITRVLKRIAQFFGLVPTSSGPIGPVPAPTTAP